MRAILIFLLLAASAVAQTPELTTVRVYTWFENERCIGCPYVPNGKGSGVLVSPNQILTAWHVVDGRRMGLPTPTGVTEHAQSVQVRFSDGHKCWATVEAEDAITDVALLRIVPHATVKPLEMGTNAVRNDIIRIHGYGWDYEYQMLRAVVSNRMSPIDPIEISPGGWQKGSVTNPNGPWVNLLGAVARPGDSGGPLTKNGKVVGIVIKMGLGYSQGVDINHIKKLFTGRLK